MGEANTKRDNTVPANRSKVKKKKKIKKKTSLIEKSYETEA